MARSKDVHKVIAFGSITNKFFSKMGRKANFLERQINGLNCMKTQYGSLDSLDSCNVKTTTKKKNKSSKFFTKKSFAERFTVSYDRSGSYRHFDDDDDDDDELNESTKLLDIREMNAKRKKLKKKKYWSIDDRADTVDRGKFRNNIKFIPEEFDKTQNIKKNKKSKSFLKRAGKFIVNTARYMSMSTPYTHLYYNGIPQDLNGYDFTRDTYGLDPTRYVYSYGYNPSLFY